LNAPVRDVPRSDRDAWLESVLEAHGPALGRLAASYAKDLGEREDLFQEIVVAIWKALPRFRGECSERTFIFRIAHNRGIAHLARRRMPSAGALDELDVQSPGPNPEQALSKAQEGQRLLEAVQRLPLGYRQVVTLALEGFGYGEIADVLGISESNVGARLTRARQMLRQLL
jgi:RNA polymerase sigma-70 factor (ECF subfamily)